MVGLGINLLDLPRQLGPYSLLKRIAMGGMAEVYIAKAEGFGGFEKLVAIKVIHPRFSEDEQFIQMLIEEAKISVLLNHVNIVQIFDLGQIDDTYFIVMEYIEGLDVHRVLKRLSTQSIALPIEAALFIAIEMCHGLHYAHTKMDSQGSPLGIVHRDISPQNVLISRSGEVKLVDFGIAKAALRSAQTQAGVIKGKYSYMSPEQASGLATDHRSDIFSTGLVLYEMLTGEMAYQKDNIPMLLEQVRKAEISAASSKRADLPKRLDDLLAKVLAKKIEDRYENAQLMGNDLTEILHEIAPSFNAAELVRCIAPTLPKTLIPSENPPPKQASSASNADRAETSSTTASLSPMKAAEFRPGQNESVLFENESFTQRSASTLLKSVVAAQVEKLSDNKSSAPAPKRKSRLSNGSPGRDPKEHTAMASLSKSVPPLSSSRPRFSGISRSVPPPRPSSRAPMSKARSARSSLPPSMGRYPARISSPLPASAALRSSRPSKAPASSAAQVLSIPSAPAVPKDLPALSLPEQSDTQIPVPVSSPPVPAAPSARPSELPVSEPPTVPDDMTAIATGAKHSFRAKRSGMWFSSFAAFVLVGVLLVVYVVYDSLRAKPGLKVVSVPEGAEITIDNRRVEGKTPQVITDGLEVGRTYRLRLERDGYEPWETQFQPSDNLVTQIAVLHAMRVTLNVDSAPSGAHLWVNGVLYGKVPITVRDIDLQQTLELRLAKSGYRETTRVVTFSKENMHPSVTVKLGRARN